MALGFSGSKGGIKMKERIKEDSFTERFKELIKLNKRKNQNGNRSFR